MALTVVPEKEVLLLLRQLEYLPSEIKLRGHFLLREAKAVDVEEADLVDGLLELRCETFFAARLIELVKMQSDEISPGKVCSRLCMCSSIRRLYKRRQL